MSNAIKIRQAFPVIISIAGKVFKYKQKRTAQNQRTTDIDRHRVQLPKEENEAGRELDISK